MDTLDKAVFLRKVTPDPLVLDAIRAFTTPSTPEQVALSAKNYVESLYDAYLILTTNSGISEGWTLQTTSNPP